MRIAIVNLITKTVDMPEKKTSILGLSPSSMKSDRETNIMELASRISGMGNEVTVFVSDTYEPEDSAGSEDGRFKVKYLKTMYRTVLPPAYIPFTPELVNEITSDHFDIVQSGEFFQLGTILASKAASKIAVPFIVWQELDVNPQFPGGILQATYNLTYGRLVTRRISTFVPRSFSARNYLLSIGMRPVDVSRVIHTGVNTQVFHPLRDEDLKTKFGIDSNSPLVLSVGRLHPNKGFDVLIRAIAKVREEVPNVSLIIKGSGPGQTQLEELIGKLDLGGNVTIITDHIPRKSMNELYNASDFTAICSRVDLFPFSAMESLACGKPVVSTFGRSVRLDIIGNHGTGIYVPNGSTRALADSIVYLIRNTKLRLRMGKNALHLCRREFDLDVVSERFCNLYHQLVGNEDSR